MSVELVLLTVPLVIIMLFVVALGRFSSARNQVDEAARDGARQASLYYRSGSQATRQGAAMADLDLNGIDCANRVVAIDTSALRPGGAVTVTVTCLVPLGDLVLLKVPGKRTVTASSTSVVDTYVEP
ncbi:MAG: pilus assembly protein [Actinomycetota bacterium]|nr:pilus assembly protein [Actinomycetota bacterium]